MRSLLYILILLLLTLSLKPCLDRANAVSSEPQTETLAGRHQDHQGDRTDGCSPFCACHCCHTHFQPQNTQVVEYASSQEAIQEVDLYRNSFISSPSYSIWQPPKVA
ncbi:DUF6660 family protein [Pontibacter saemangeumensis]|uniref:DUF6660 family protein n=1 Tax=Pontibacter saemangeumensis TaxID=1084525 RepID=UPI003CD0B9C9